MNSYLGRKFCVGRLHLEHWLLVLDLGYWSWRQWALWVSSNSVSYDSMKVELYIDKASRKMLVAIVLFQIFCEYCLKQKENVFSWCLGILKLLKYSYSLVKIKATENLCSLHPLLFWPQNFWCCISQNHSVIFSLYNWYCFTELESSRKLLSSISEL